MSGLNHVHIIGRLGKEPELRHTQGGSAVTTLSVATSRAWKDQQGNKQEETEWHRVTLWARQAEVAAEYLRKGSEVGIFGRLQTRKWQDSNGNDRYTTEIVASELVLIGGRSSSRNDDMNQDPAGGPPATAKKSAPRQPQGNDFDDDIPF